MDVAKAFLEDAGHPAAEQDFEANPNLFIDHAKGAILAEIKTDLASLGIRFTRVLTDNGACYRSRRFQRLCRRLQLKNRRSRPYSPRTNGKVERFIQTVLREWAYAWSYASSEERGRHLTAWLYQYNWHRPHASLSYQPPISRLGLSVNNLQGSHLEMTVHDTLGHRKRTV